MVISERDRRALILGGVALAMIGLYFLLIEPAWNWYEGLIAAHRTAAGRLAQGVYERNKRDHQRRQVQEWEASKGPPGAPKPFAEGITSIGADIIAASQSSGVELQGTTPGAATPWLPEPTLLHANIQIEGKADWENVFKFIAALYRIEGVLSVEQMDLTVADPKKPGKLSLRLSVSVLLQAAGQEGVRWAS